MNNKYLDVQNMLNQNHNFSHIVENLGVSLGTISKVKNMNINIEDYKVNKAVIWAAGWGSRLMPITKNIPKPLVEVKGTSFIESNIIALKKAGINDITIVVGRQKEKFYELIEKYKLNKIINTKWETHNNISSYYAAINVLEGGAYLLDADLLISSEFSFRQYASNSFMYTSYQDVIEDLLIEKKGARAVGYIKPDENEIINGEQYKGIFYLIGDDLKTLNKEVRNVYDIKDVYNEHYWFDPLFKLAKNEIKLITENIKFDDVVEVDYIEDLVKLDKTYAKYIKGEKND